MTVKIFTTAREMISRWMRLLRRKVRALVGRQSKQKSSDSEIYSLFQEASDLSGKRRDKFLEDLRRENEADYREIVSLLASDDSQYIFPPPAPPEPMLKPGDTLGRYEILEFIDRGGMSEVYKASHPELGIRALKILTREVAENAALVGRLRLEAKSASALNHRNIVTIHHFDQQGHLHYMVMEFVDGQSLRKMIGNLSVKEAVNYATQMAEALGFAHGKGIIHRDIKPENIMVRTDGSVKILDFGLAKPVLLGPESPAGASASFGSLGIKSDPHVLMGTLPYMAPEQLDFKDASAQSDIWSWGVVFYEMLAGRRPFEASTDYEIEAIRKKEPGPPSRHRELNRIALKALRKKPAERYQTMAEAVPGLEKFIIPSWTRRIAALALWAILAAAGYWKYLDSLNPHLRAVDTQEVQLTTNPEGHSVLPAISISGKRLVYTEEGRAESVLTLVEIADGAPRDPHPLARSSDGEFMGAAFAPNDDQTVFVLLQNRVNGVGILYRLRLVPAGAVENEGGPPGSAIGIRLDFAQDKNACQDSSWNVASIAWYHRASGSGRFEPLCQNPPGEQMAALASMDSPPSVSPDGKYFVFFMIEGKTNNTALIVAGAEGGEETLVTKYTSGQENSTQNKLAFLYPLWSPDGHEVLTATWVTSDTTLWRTTLRNGKPVGEPKSYYLPNLLFRGKPAWLNHGRSIAVSASINRNIKSQIVQIFFDSGKWEPMLAASIGDLDSITCPQGLFPSNCQQSLIGAKEDDMSSVRIERLSDNGTSRITNNGTFSGLTWKDDDSLISESEHVVNPDLVLMNANRLNESPASITADEYWERDPVVSPDGRFLVYYSNSKGGIHLFRIDLNNLKAEGIRLTSRNWAETQPSISPSGKAVMFTAIDNGLETLWEVSINGGEPRPIAPHHRARNGSRSRDGQIVCKYLLDSGPEFTWQWIIAVLDDKGQVLHRFTDIPTRTPVKWSPDGKSIFYVKEQNGLENIWKRSVKDGGPDTQVTHFGEERIFAFALSPNGNRVACLCGHKKYSHIVRMPLIAK
jgi:serine/threonine protein kinase/Tol biopolymer transport system component